jgi:hypothetical protein
MCTSYNLSGCEIHLTFTGAFESLIAGISPPLRLLAVATLILCHAATTSAMLVTPVSSNFSASSTIDGATITDPFSQGATLNSLSPTTSVSNGGLTMTVNGSAVWANAASLDVDLDLLRPDSEPNGTQKSFSGDGIFNYTFTVASDTTVTVDYGVLATSTHTDIAANAYVWWAMQPYYIRIDGGSIKTLLLPGNFDPFQPSPFINNGTVVADILAGTHTIRITASNGATGNQPGHRAMAGSFGIQIGPVPALDGDLDGDGFVGITDLNIVLGAWNQSVPPADPLADPSGDGFVGIEDLNTVLGNWNAGTPPPVESVAVIPEPSSLLLLLGGSLPLLIRSG